MQIVHGVLPVTLHRMGKGADRQIDVAQDDFHLVLRRVAEHIVRHLGLVARVADANAQTIEVFLIAQRADDAESVVGLLQLSFWAKNHPHTPPGLGVFVEIKIFLGLPKNIFAIFLIRTLLAITNKIYRQVRILVRMSHDFL